MDYQSYEFKSRKTIARKWEDILEWERHFTTDAAAQDYAQACADADGAEIRWNRAGLNQGHYVSPGKVN